jgi:cytochrome c oxidase assembly protein subunit 15
LKTLAGLSLLLVILLVSLSAYLRLAHSGIGCLDWPQCYGRIGVPEVSVPDGRAQSGSTPEQLARDAYKRITAESEQAMAWATPLHRGVASVLGICIVFLNLLAFHQKRHRLLSLSLLGLTVWLAMLGLRSGSLHDPAVVMGNLSGGFAMLGLLGWLWFSLNARPRVRFDAHSDTPPLPRALLIAALLALCLQIALGGLTSANFAATACMTLPDCHGGWLPGPELFEALDLSRHHEVTAEGLAIGGAERTAIHRAHRLMAVLASVLILLAAQMAMRRAGSPRRTGMLLLLLIFAEFTVGVAAVFMELPIILAVAHNWLAGLLLLALLRLLSLNRSRL